MKKTIAALLTAGLLIAGVQTTALAKSAARAKKTVAGPQWDRTITMTADGFPVMGNPAAPVKVVEFISLYSDPVIRKKLEDFKGGMKYQYDWKLNDAVPRP